jgi:hypothetical protein
MNIYLKKSLRINGALLMLLGTTIFNISPAKAVDFSQVLGADLTWQCGWQPSIQPRVRITPSEASQDSVRVNILPCESKPEPPKITAAAPAPAPVPDLTPAVQLVQQGIVIPQQLIQSVQPLIQMAQPLLLQLLQPLPQAPQQVAPAPVQAPGQVPGQAPQQAPQQAPTGTK